MKQTIIQNSLIGICGLLFEAAYSGQYSMTATDHICFVTLSLKYNLMLELF